MSYKIRNRKHILALFGFLPLIALQIHNATILPLSRGFDAYHHADYIKYIKTYAHLPLPPDGWEMYQAPLYYLIGAILPDIAALRIVQIIAWTALGIVGYIFLSRSFDKTLAMAGTLLLMSLPVVIYATPLISNEFFSSVVIDAAFAMYLLTREKTSWKDGLIPGFLLGLALLSKATAIILAGLIFADLIFSLLRFRKIVYARIVVLLSAFIMSGWFYLRSLVLYKNPFIASIDFPRYAFTEQPWDRGFKFFLDLTPFLKLEMFTAQHNSLWAGTYFSWFYDGHNAIVPVQGFSKAGALLILASIPFVLLAIYGMLRILKKINGKELLILLYPIFLFAAYVLYNFKIPYYSTVKAVFLLSSAIPFVYLTVKGLEPFKKYYFVFLVYMIFYILLVLKNFWILSTWR